ncbi:MAG TPA: hypothetical protein VKT77_15320 [Chthonomonadaceae bacterium]|nr:hypothetical protein [Chthonomonadaceae bacterium]
MTGLVALGAHRLTAATAAQIELADQPLARLQRATPSRPLNSGTLANKFNMTTSSSPQRSLFRTAAVSFLQEELPAAVTKETTG